MDLTITEEDRQLLLLSLSFCLAHRPGFQHACRTLAEKLNGRDMLEAFGRTNVEFRKHLLCLIQDACTQASLSKKRTEQILKAIKEYREAME